MSSEREVWQKMTTNEGLSFLLVLLLFLCPRTTSVIGQKRSLMKYFRKKSLKFEHLLLVQKHVTSMLVQDYDSNAVQRNKLCLFYLRRHQQSGTSDMYVSTNWVQTLASVWSGQNDKICLYIKKSMIRDIFVIIIKMYQVQT